MGDRRGIANDTRQAAGPASAETQSDDARTLGGQTLIVFAGNLIVLVLGVPFQIYVARALGADTFGLYGLAEAVVATLTGIGALGVAATAVRFVAEHVARGEARLVRALMALSTLILAAVGGVMAAVLAGATRPLAEWWGLKPQAASILEILALLAPVSLLSFLYQQILRGFQSIVVIVLAGSLLSLCLKAVLTITLLRAGWGVEGYAWATVVSGWLVLAVLAGAAWRLALRMPVGATPSPLPVRRWARFAAISHAGALLDATTIHMDRFLVGSLLGAESVAVLIIAKQIAQFPTVLYNGFLMVLAPMFAAASGTGDHGRRQSLFHLTTDWIVRLAMPLILFLAVFAGPILELYGPQFRSHGVWLLEVGLVAAAVNAAIGPTGILLRMSGEETAMLRVSAASTLVLLASYVVWVPAAGLTGAGLAQLSAVVLLKGVSLRVAAGRLGIAWWSDRYRLWIWPAVTAIAFLALMALAASHKPSLPLQTAGLALLVALAGTYLAALGGIMLGGASKDDTDLMRSIAARLGFGRSGLRGAAPSQPLPHHEAVE